MFLITQFLNNPNITEQGRLHQLARVHIQTEAAQAVDTQITANSQPETGDSNKYN